MPVTFFLLIETVQSELSKNDNQGYLVGGTVRDFLLNRKTSDLDFAVKKNPKELAERLKKNLKGTLIKLKEEREIFRIITKDGTQLDLAKFKGKTIEADLSMRDFTINAMAIPLISDFGFRISDFNSQSTIRNTQLLDPYEGKKDIEKKLVRQISAEIYKEDPLRLLRAFRLSAQLEFEIEQETLNAIQKNRKKIKQSSAERIREELLATLDCPCSIPFIKKMDVVGLISEILPEVEPNRICALEYYPGKGVWGHSLDGLECLEWIFENLESEFPENFEKISDLAFQKLPGREGHSMSAIMKLGILLHDIGKAPTAKVMDGRLRFFEHQEVGAKMAKTIAKRLRFSSEAVSMLSQLVYSHMRAGGLAFSAEVTERAKYRFFRDLGIVAIPMLLVSLADRYTYLAPEERGKGVDPHEKIYKELIRWHFQKEAEKPAGQTKLLNGDILIEKLALQPGPLIGEILKSVEEARALGEIRTEEEALEFAKRFLKRKEPQPLPSPNPPLSPFSKGG